MSRALGGWRPGGRVLHVSRAGSVASIEIADDGVGGADVTAELPCGA